MINSCTIADSFFSGDAVAKIGGHKLYREEVEKLIPKGIPTDDSLAIARQYIDSWAIKELMYLEAQDELPKDDKDVDQLLEDYKMQLLIFKYEDKYISDRLDTVITASQRREYFDSHPQLFISEEGLMKARMVKIREDSPNVQIIRNLAKSNDPGGLDELEEAAFNSADKYSNFNNQWVNLRDVCREIGTDLEYLQNKYTQGRIVEIRDSSYITFLIVLDRVRPGDVAPFEYNDEKIKEIILSKRKQELISQLHKDIYNNALDKKKLKIIEYEPNN